MGFHHISAQNIVLTNIKADVNELRCDRRWMKVANGLGFNDRLWYYSLLSLFFPSFVRLIDVFNTLLVFSTLLSLL
jgi:hypothetical protein